MKKANLPGFSAASSLYTPGMLYPVVVNRRGGHATATVIPQLRRSFSCSVALGVADALCKAASASACLGALIRAERVCED